VLSRFFSLLLPLPTAAFSTIMAKRNATAEELEAQAKSNGYKRGAHREKDSARDDGTYNDKTEESKCGIGPLCDGRLSARANFDINTFHIRWTLLQMRKDAL
jgi:hypothetical protein